MSDVATVYVIVSAVALWLKRAFSAQLAQGLVKGSAVEVPLCM